MSNPQQIRIDQELARLQVGIHVVIGSAGNNIRQAHGNDDPIMWELDAIMQGYYCFRCRTPYLMNCIIEKSAIEMVADHGTHFVINAQF